MLRILIPCSREEERVYRLLDSLSLIEVPYTVIMIRNSQEDIDLSKYKFDIKYIKDLSKNLGSIYKKLLDSVPSGDYFLFMEDDDYLIDSIEEEDIQEDITLCGYNSPDNMQDSINWQRTRRMYNIKMNINIFEEREKYDSSFQISCFIAKKKDIDLDVWDCSLENDFKLFLRYLYQAESLHYKRGTLFMQTILDNISFSKYNKDTRWPMQ